MFDAGNLAIIMQTLMFAALVIGSFYAHRYNSRLLIDRLDRTDAGLENVQVEVKGLAEIIKTQAVQNVRLDNHEQRLGQHDVLIDDLRRGEGYILPITGHRK